MARAQKTTPGEVIAAGLPHFDVEAEESARAYEALGETLLAALTDFQAGGQAKGEAWGRSREGRKQLGLEQMPGVGFTTSGICEARLQRRSVARGRPTARRRGASSGPRRPAQCVRRRDERAVEDGSGRAPRSSAWSTVRSRRAG